MNKRTFEEELDRTGKFTYFCKGISMLPLLRQEKDLFTIEKKVGRCKKYDVVLYKRQTGAYVLHRIVEVREKDYVMLGDHCLYKEYGIPEERVLGVMTSFVRDGKEYSVKNIGYQAYAVLWYKLYPLRVLLHKVINKKFFALRKKNENGR